MDAFENYFAGLRNKSIAVLGLGVSNRPLVRLLLEFGCDVVGCDKTPRDKLDAEVLALEQAGCKLHVGERYLDGVEADIVFRTPGMHPANPAIEALRARGVTDSRAREAAAVSAGSIGRALSVASDEGFWQRRSEVMRDFFALESRSDILRISGQWKDRRDQSDELLFDVEDMLRTLLLVRLGKRNASAAEGFPAPWRRMAAQADVSAFVKLMDAVARARQLKGNQVTWQAVVERLLLSLMEEKSQWST